MAGPRGCGDEGRDASEPTQANDDPNRRHLRTDDEVAIKILHGDVAGHATAVERFGREARAPARICNEHARLWLTVLRACGADVADFGPAGGATLPDLWI